MEDTEMHAKIVNDDQIRETAYLFWLDDGQPAGRDEEHWLRAVDALTKPTPKPRAARKAVAKPRETKSATKRVAKPRAKTAK
jgi:hypothetical protein